MLDTTEKVIERIISNRIEEHAEQVHAISDNQFGFRSGRSTTICAVCKIGHEGMSSTRWLDGAKVYRAVITLDVNNAFYSTSCTNITNVLRSIKTPKY